MKHPMNPMKTKRVKCTVKPILLHDGMGDQATSVTDPSPRQSGIHNTCLDTNNEIAADKKSDVSPFSLEITPLKFHYNMAVEQRTICKSRGDAETMNPEVTDSGDRRNSFRVENVPNMSYFDETKEYPSAIKITRIVDKEIETTDRLRRINVSNLPDENDAITNLEKPAHLVEKIDKNIKKLNNFEKQKRNILHKKPISCTSENCDKLPTTHECDKKKFYDPKDIRKYIIKKKTERQAKEKEEKNKKANELAAMKRKAEINKLFTNRNKFPSYCNSANTVKDVCEHTKATKKMKNNALVDPRFDVNSKYHSHPVVVHNKPSAGHFSLKEYAHTKENSRPDSQDTKTRNKGSNYRLNEYLRKTEFETERYFKQRFDNIITKRIKEADKIANTKLHPPVEELMEMRTGDHDLLGSVSKQTQTSENEGQLEMPTVLDVFRTASPYNFLNVLKGKVNLAQNTNTCLENLYENRMFTTPPQKQIDLAMLNEKGSPDDVHNKRPKLAANGVHAGYEKLGLTHLKPELTLSDLNLSPQVQNETFTVAGPRKSDKTFTVSDHELRRKSAKVHRNTKSKENLNISFEMSGIRPLASSTKPLVSTPLTEKNANCVDNFSEVERNTRFQGASERQSYTLSGEKNNRILSDRTFTSLENKIAEGKRDEINSQKPVRRKLTKVLSSESLKAQDVSLVLPESCPPNCDESCDVKQSINHSFALPEKLDTSFLNNCTLMTQDSEAAVNEADGIEETKDINSFILPSDDFAQFSSSAVFLDLYDQMINSEDEKLLQILKKIQQQKEALNKYLRSEVFALEMQKNAYREKKEDEKIKTIKKRQRGILLKVTKNILELDKMKKSVIETVGKRKAELLKQKATMTDRKVPPKHKFPPSKQKKKPDQDKRTILVSKQMKTFFGISSSSCTSVILENDTRNEQVNFNELSTCIQNDTSVMAHAFSTKTAEVKDTATSPVHFNAGISIRLDLNPEKLLQLKNSCAEVKIQSMKNSSDGDVTILDRSQCRKVEKLDECTKQADVSEENDGSDVRDSKIIKIKRALSPVPLPPSKKALQIRRLSSSSDLTFVSFNDTTTTDQSDIELRISALQEQLRQRKLEAERLRKEEKQLRKEKLRSKEQSLLKQLEAYDQYIKRLSQMLTENDPFSALTKPQIKNASSRKYVGGSSSLRDKNHAERSDFIAPAEGVTEVTRRDDKHLVAEDLETNTEDSDKQLKKADSGILIESEVTEPSENVDVKCLPMVERARPNEAKGSAADDVRSSVGSVVHTETSTSPQGRTDRTVTPSKTLDPGNYLRMINDLQSEVLSLSEQLYSSDFVEDIPEDLPDTKSDVSENVANGNNTSMSVEEIQSDHQSDASEQNKSLGERLKKNVQPPAEIQTEILPAPSPETDERDFEADAAAPPAADTPEEVESTQMADNDDRVSDTGTERTEIRFQSIENLESVSSELDDGHSTGEDKANANYEPETSGSDIVVAANGSPAAPDQRSPKGVHFEIRDTDASSDGELNIFNVKNISDIESSDNAEAVYREPLSEAETPSVQDDDSFIHEIKSASSLENISDEMKSSFRLDGSDLLNESKTSHGLIKLDYLNESEGSNVEEVDTPVQPLGEVQTVMDAIKFSTSEDTAGGGGGGKSWTNVEERYDNARDNLKSYLDSRMLEALIVGDRSILNEFGAGYGESAGREPFEKPEIIVRAQTPLKNVGHSNLEETDVSESLEYDAVPVTANVQVTDLDDVEVASSASSDAASLDEESAEHVEEALGAKTSESKADSAGSSREEDRSVEEEFVEDFSIPNLLGKTFIVNDDDSHAEVVRGEELADGSPSRPEKTTPEDVDVKLNDDDLDQITELETPFLQALRRERENLLARKEESVDKITLDLFETLIEETCVDLVSTINQKMNDREAETVLADEPESLNEVIEELSKGENEVDESFHTSKHVNKFENEWFEKQLNYEQSRIREAEELRLQQMKIEQEIEELQAQQHIPPYVYLREIPNKPPPPYTPPSDHSVKIPGNEIELRESIGTTVGYVCDALDKGNNVDDIMQLPEYSQISKVNREVASYKRFLFDLTKEVARNILGEPKKPASLPWQTLSRQKVSKPPPKRDELAKMIENEMHALFGFKSKINKEKLIIQWSRKKRTDFVDDLLIQELQEEENEWTNYDEDELIIKNQITESLLDDLIDDTVRSLQDACQKVE